MSASLTKHNEPDPRLVALRSAVLGSFTQQDVIEIVQALKRKAIDGDIQAARVLLAYLIGPPNDAGIKVKQAVIVNHAPSTNGKPPKNLPDARERIVRYIAMEGPAQLGRIAVDCCISEVIASESLNHRWFKEEADGWHITAKAREDVFANDEVD